MELNITDCQGNSALILACRHYKDYAKDESVIVIKQLIAKGADTSVVSTFPSTIRGYGRDTAL